MKNSLDRDGRRYSSFKEFYPFYLSEHANAVCRRLHFVGSVLSLGLLGTAFATQRLTLLAAIPIVAYGFAWTGHIFFERNKPATFQYPFFSLLGDWVMFRDMLIGRVRW